jgi:PKHD-type hydroxylase
MQLKHSYWHFKEAIDPETCQKIIDAGLARMADEEAKGRSTTAYTFGNADIGAKPNATPQGELSKQQAKEQGITDVYVRDSNVTWLNDQWLYNLFYPYISTANAEAGWNWQWDYSENFQFTKYEPGQFYSWHTDGGSDHNAIYKRYIHGITNGPLEENGRINHQYTNDAKMIGKVRKISMTVNLNLPGEYEGGNLKFDFGQHVDYPQFHECEEVRPQGSIIIFPSFLNHCVTPVTSGTRYSLVLWVLGEPWK